MLLQYGLFLALVAAGFKVVYKLFPQDKLWVFWPVAIVSKGALIYGHFIGLPAIVPLGLFVLTPLAIGMGIRGFHLSDSPK